MYLWVSIDSNKDIRSNVIGWLDKPQFDKKKGLFFSTPDGFFQSIEFKKLPNELVGKIQPGQCKRFKIRFE